MKNNIFKEAFEKTAIGIAIQVVRDLWNTNQKIIYIDLVVTGLLSTGIVGFLYEQIQLNNRSIRYFSIIDAVKGSFSSGIIFTLLLFLCMNYCTYRIAAALHKETLKDSERNYDASHEGYKGTAHKMTDEERDEVFIHGDYSELKELIIGADVNDILKMYAVNYDIYGSNHNMIMFGSPGIGKSRCYAIPMIMQTIRMGNSMIITDPKGELYRETAAMAKANGYIVKILNFKPENILHSDTCDYMSVIGNKTYIAQSFSKTVVDNTNDGKPADFWTNSEFSFFIGLALLVSSGDGFHGLPKTLGSVYEILISNSAEDFEDMTEMIPDSHPAKPFLNTWANGDKTVKGNTYAGLQIRLSSLGNPLIRKLCSTPDIDLTLPGREKCIYYIGSSDTDKSMSYLVALFITLLCNALVSAADSTDEGYLKVRVTMLLDELANIGRIPDYTEKLSTFRGRHIDIISILQDLGQLQKMYPENEWESIMNDCHLKILLRTNNILTSEYFSKLSGEQTTEEKSKRYEEKAGDLLKIHTSYNVSESHGERMLYTPHEIRTLDKRNVLVYMAGENVIEMRKIDYSNHPMCKELRKWPATKHAPKWILEMPETERIENGIYNEKYRREETDDIELCTEDDFKHPWTKEDEEKLQMHIAEFKAKKRKEREELAQVENEQPIDTDIIKKEVEKQQQGQAQQTGNKDAEDPSDAINSYLKKNLSPKPDVSSEKEQEQASDNPSDAVDVFDQEQMFYPFSESDNADINPRHSDEAETPKRATHYYKKRTPSSQKK